MGYIRDFIGGAGEAAAVAGFEELRAKSLRERDEANYIRQRNLDKLRYGSYAERDEAERKFKAEEGQKDRETQIKVAGIRSEGTGYKPPTVKTITNDDGTETTVQWNRQTGQWEPFNAGSVAGAGGGISLDEAMAMAQREYDDKASMFQTDQYQFGMSEAEWVNQRAQQIMSGQGPSAGATPGAGTTPAAAPSKEEYISAVVNHPNNAGKDADELRKKAEARWNEKYSGVSAKPDKKKGLVNSAANKPEPKEEPKRQPRTEPTGTGRRQSRKFRQDAGEQARREYKDKVPGMNNEELSAWFDRNWKYLTLAQQEEIRRKLGKETAGRNK